MEWYQILTTAISVLSLPTISGLIIKDLYEKKKTDRQHVSTLRENERQESLRDVIREEMCPLSYKIDILNTKMDQISDGTLSSLRNDILNCYYRCREKGYRNDYDYQNIHDLYKAYAGLHGNSFVKDIMDRFDRLPTKEEYRLQHQIAPVAPMGGTTGGEG